MIRPLSSLFVLSSGPSRSSESRANPFVGTRGLTVRVDDGDEQAHGLSAFAGSANRAFAAADPVSGRAIYLWGHILHPAGLTGEALLCECARLIDQNDSESLRTLLGHFVIIVDDRWRERVVFVSDVLGVRPFFAGSFAGRLVAGSDVLSICEAGLSSGQADLDAISSWLCFNFDCSGGSIVTDYKRLAPGSICVFDHTGKLLSETRYAPLRFGCERLPPAEMIEALHGMVGRSMDLYLRNLDAGNLPLSGGYDSRYLCALAAERGFAPRLHLATVQTTLSETAAAQQVAQALGLPLQLIPVGAHVLDLFDDPFQFGGDGFPRGRNLTSAVVRMHPGMPIISGFMGDLLMRGPLSDGLANFLAQDDNPDLSDEHFARSAYSRVRSAAHRPDLLQDPIGNRAKERAMQLMMCAVQQGRAAGRPMTYVNFQLRHRLYFAGIILGHDDEAEALLPFYSWELIDFRARYHPSIRRDSYQLLFDRFFPKLAAIPHCTAIPVSPASGPQKQDDRPSRHMRRWSLSLMRALLRRRSAVHKRKLLRRLPNSFFSGSRYQTEVRFLYKFDLWERRLAESGVMVDWSKI